MGRLMGIVTISILLFSLLLIGITVASVLSGDTSATIEENLEQMTNEAVDEISTYIQIRDQKGKYYNINGEQRIEKIMLLISPLVSQDIDVSQLTIQIDNGESVRILTYNGNVADMDSNSLFEHTIWDYIDGNNFGFITITDSDGSLVEYNTINDYSDNAYIIIRLPPDMTMEYKDKIVVTLFPSTGITRITVLEASLPMKQVVTFE